jgi:hypothetical protein
MVLVRYSGPACGALTLLFPGSAAIRSALVRVKATGTPVDLLPSLLRFEAFLDFIGLGEVRELEQRFAQA